jgi:hypothetical protein
LDGLEDTQISDLVDDVLLLCQPCHFLLIGLDAPDEVDIRGVEFLEQVIDFRRELGE